MTLSPLETDVKASVTTFVAGRAKEDQSHWDSDPFEIIGYPRLKLRHGVTPMPRKLVNDYVLKKS